MRDGTDRPIVLVGFIAAGKSTVGERLAARLGLPFVDSEKEIQKAFRLSVAELVRTKGEWQFRQAEQHFVQALARSHAQVVALGGVAFADIESRARLKDTTVTIWLDPPFELLLSRLKRSSTRLLFAAGSESALSYRWQEGHKIYCEAHYRVAVHDDDPELTVDAILPLLTGALPGSL